MERKENDSLQTPDGELNLYKATESNIDLLEIGIGAKSPGNLLEEDLDQRILDLVGYTW